jgi:hypothetical protein
VTIQGGGSIEVTNLEKIDLANVNLASSVNVNIGGTLSFGFINYGTDTTDTFKITGGTAVSDPNAQFLSSTSVENDRILYNQPLDVLNGGKLNFVTSTTVASYVLCEATGTVSVQGTQANPNLTLTVTGNAGIDSWAIYVLAGGTLNLAPGATISGDTTVRGLMQLLDPPQGLNSNTCTINGYLLMMGTEAVNAQLNLNYRTLNIANPGAGLGLDYATVTTAINYDLGLMGNITAPGVTVTFVDTNTLAVGIIAGTPKTFSMPVLSAGDVGTGFTTYTFPPNSGLSQTTTAGTITINHQ